MQAYKKMALRHHPDKVAAEEREESEAKFKLLGAAHAVLSDADKRQKYDAGKYQVCVPLLDGQYGCTGGGAAGNRNVFTEPKVCGIVFGQPARYATRVPSSFDAFLLMQSSFSKMRVR